MIFLNILLSTLPLVDAPAPPAPATLPTSSLLQDEAAEAAADPAWKGAVTVGASVSDGNTKIKRASATADAVKDMEDHRYTLGFQWNFAQETGVITQRRTLARAQYDKFISEKMYWLANVSFEADSQADLDLRTIAGFGLGYQFKDTEKFKLAGEAGLSYFDEDYGDDDADGDYIAARLAYKWDYLHSDRWAFSQNAEIYPSLEESDDVYAKVDTRAKATLTDNMFAQLQWLFDWDNTPASGKKRVDNLYLLTVGWKF